MRAGPGPGPVQRDEPFRSRQAPAARASTRQAAIKRRSDRTSQSLLGGGTRPPPLTRSPRAVPRLWGALGEARLAVAPPSAFLDGGVRSTRNAAQERHPYLLFCE